MLNIHASGTVEVWTVPTVMFLVSLVLSFETEFFWGVLMFLVSAYVPSFPVVLPSGVGFMIPVS